MWGRDHTQPGHAMNVLCPDRGQLREYATGNLDGTLGAAIDDHLDDCPECRGAVDTLDEQLTPVARWLRGTPAPVGRQDGVLLELAARVKALTPAPDQDKPDCTAAQFAERLARSGLLSAEERTELPPESAGAGADLARRLVERKTLTAFQAEELLRDRGDGLVLGNYVLLEPAGAGGMGRVFKAWHRRMKRVVALKMLAPELLRSEAARVRFQREAEAAARLTHPHIVAAYDAAEERGRHFLVMEYVAGRTLEEVVKGEGPLPVGRALDCLLQAARGLAHAHASGVVHRDVKPANLLLDEQGTVKVLDLGLARLELAEGDTAAELTSQNVVMGTASYLAPEQATDPSRADLRADIYGLGCTLHFLLTGEPPYRGATALETVLAHREQPVPSLRGRRPDCPPALDKLFQTLVAKRPEDRPASLAAVIAGLERLGTGQAAAPARPIRRSRLVPSLVALAASALLCWAVQPAFRAAKHLKETPGALAPAPTPSRKPAVEMVLVEAGPFLRGSPDTDTLAAIDEKPRSKIRISRPFYLGKFEVTQRQFWEVMGSNPSDKSPGRNVQAFRGKKADNAQHPVDSVTWLEAVKFCNKLSERHGLKPYYRIEGDKVGINDNTGYRLPMEAEWEYACRAGSDRRWTFGDDARTLDEYAWYTGNAGNVTHAVGTKKANAWGLHDMHGNVPEWCWDRYDRGYYQDSAVSDPSGSGKGTTRVFRGGGVSNAAAQTRSAARAPLGRGYGVLDRVGFRVARNVEP